MKKIVYIECFALLFFILLNNSCYLFTLPHDKKMNPDVESITLNLDKQVYNKDENIILSISGNIDERYKIVNYEMILYRPDTESQYNNVLSNDFYANTDCPTYKYTIKYTEPVVNDENNYGLLTDDFTYSSLSTKDIKDYVCFSVDKEGSFILSVMVNGKYNLDGKGDYKIIKLPFTVK